MYSVLRDDNLYVQRPLNQSRRIRVEYDATTNKKSSMMRGTCTSEANCHCSGMPELKWDIHNESQLAKVGLIESQECHSGLDCWSHLCLNFNHTPGHTQQQKEQHCHEYLSRVSVSDVLQCKSEVYQNDYNLPVQAVALLRISELMTHKLTQELNNRIDCVTCSMGLAIMQWWRWRYVPRTLWCIWDEIMRQQ